MRVAFALSTCLALAAASPWPRPRPMPQETEDPTVYDPVVLDLSDMAQEPYDKVMKPCSDPSAQDAGADPRQVFDDLGCPALLDALNKNYTDTEDKGGLSYIEYLSNRMHGPPNRDCTDINNEACSDSDIQCDDTYFTCGFLLLNSFSNVFNMLKRAHDQTQAAHDRMQDDLPAFTEHFAPELPPDHTGDLAVAIIAVGLFGVGTFAERLIKPVMDKAAKKAAEKGKEVKDKFGTVKDGMMVSAGMATPLTLNNLGSGLEGKTTDSKITEIFGRVYDQLRKMQSAQVESLFGGSKESQEALYKTIGQGLFISYNDEHDWEEMETEIKKMIFAALIPRAWEIAPDLQDKDEIIYSNPLFLNTNKPCDEDPDDGYAEKLKEDKYKKICYEDEGWYMLAAKIEKKKVDRYSRHWVWNFAKLPGYEKLLGDGGYDGLTAEDMLASAVGGWEENNHRQYYEPPTDAEIVTGEGDDQEVQWSGGVRAPGLARMLVCSDWGSATDTIYQAASKKGGGDDLTKNDQWPCG